MNADQVQPSSTDETAADESQVADALRAGLDDFDLSDEDLALLGRDDVDDVADDEEATRPVVAIIGRPNVGKSTLVNRIIGRREAVVEDVPGVTRDRVAYDGDWSGRNFTLVDTGGWEIDATGIHLRVAEQAEVAVDLADAVLFVVDATVGATDDDEAVVKLLRRSGKPVILIANKVDDQRGEADATLRLDGQLAAYVVALLDGDVYRVYDGRMDSASAAYSPGRLIEAAALNRALSDPRFALLDWMSGVAAEKLLVANTAEGRARLVATSGSRYLRPDRRDRTPVISAVGSAGFQSWLTTANSG